MKTLHLLLPIVASLVSCGSRPVTSKPANEEIAGVWACNEFPKGFLHDTSDSLRKAQSRIEFFANGTCRTTAFPQRDPYRFIDVNGAAWTMTDPSMTPTGTWSIEFNGLFLQCRKDAGSLVLRYTISATDHYYINFSRSTQP